MRFARKLRKDEDGSTIVEMAIALPVLTGMIYGIFIFGQLFQANAAMQHALGEGARFGNLCLGVTNGSCTLPTATAIRNKVTSKLFGPRMGTFGTPSVTTSTASAGYVTVSMTYTQTPDFLFFSGPAITLNKSKRVYLADSPPSASTCTNPPTGTTAPVSCSLYN